MQPWTVIDQAQGPIYWRPKPDGAKFRCAECGEDFNHTQIRMTKAPNGNKGMFCDECLDPRWVERATNGGTL